MTNDLTDKRIRTCGGVGGVSVEVRVRFRVMDQEGGKNGGRKECIEGKEGWEGSGEGKNNRMN